MPSTEAIAIVYLQSALAGEGGRQPRTLSPGTEGAPSRSHTAEVRDHPSAIAQAIFF